MAGAATSASSLAPIVGDSAVSLSGNAYLIKKQPHRQFRETRLLSCEEWAELRRDPVGAGKRLRTRPRLIGYSRSADRTFFVIPELRIGLDAGEVRGIMLDQVFLTHTHSDHALDVHWFAVARADGTDVYTPAVTTDFVMAFTRNTMSMNLARPVTEAELAGFRLHGVTPGQIIPELGRARDWQARVFACHHSVPCVGYAFSQRKKVRKQEYQSRSPAEMKVLRAQGVEFEEWRAEPRFVYVGDTSIGVFESEPWLFDYPIIIVECTFLEPTLDGVDLAARCERDGHIYFAGALEHVVRAHPSLMFVLIHFSLRYEIDEITAFFRRFPDLPNIRLHVGSMSDLTSHHLESDDPLLSSTLGHTKPCP